MATKYNALKISNPQRKPNPNAGPTTITKVRCPECNTKRIIEEQPECPQCAPKAEPMKAAPKKKAASKKKAAAKPESIPTDGVAPLE